MQVVTVSLLQCLFRWPCLLAFKAVRVANMNGPMGNSGAIQLMQRPLAIGYWLTINHADDRIHAGLLCLLPAEGSAHAHSGASTDADCAEAIVLTFSPS